MSKNIKRIGLLLLALGLLIGVFFLFTHRAREAQAQALNKEFETVEVQEGFLEITISAIGNVRSAQSTELAWETSGIVEKVYYEEGYLVESGAILATLEQTSLPQDIILARSNLEEYLTTLDELSITANVSKTKAVSDISIYTHDVRDAQYQLDNFTVPSDQSDLGTWQALTEMGENLDVARIAFEPYKYYDSGDDTREEYWDEFDAAQADYNSAVKRLEYETELEVAEANLEKALQDYEKWKDGPTDGEIASAEARVASAQAALSKAGIDAPFDGTLTIVNPQPGDHVNLNTPAFRLDNLSTLYVDIEVSEVDINNIDIGQEATIQLDAITEKEYLGKVVEISSIGTISSGVVNYKVTIQMTDFDKNVLPGMTAEVEIIVEESEASLLIPNQAIRTDDDDNLVVYIMDQFGQMKEIEITLGESSDTQSEVKGDDLKIGDLVITNPPSEEDEEGTSQMMGGPRPIPGSAGQGGSAPEGGN